MGNSFNASKVIVSMVVVLSLGLLLFVVQPGRAEVTANFRAPFFFVFDDPCTGPVFVEGVFHFLFKTEGEGRDSVHINAKGTGESLVTGDTFIYVQTINDQCTFEDDCLPFGEVFVLDTIVTENLIGKGPAPKLIFHIQFSETFDTFTVKNLVVQCQ